METIVYRKIDTSPWIQALHTSESASSPHTTAMADSGRETGPLPLDLLFPVVTAEEMVTWTHLAPHVFGF